jgi:predicted transcriptional regulator
MRHPLGEILPAALLQEQQRAIGDAIARKLAAKIAAAFVRRNQIGSDQLGPLISTVHRALAILGKPPTEVNDKRIPAVPIRRSVHRDYVVCLECGSRSQMLKRHLATGHELTVAQGAGPIADRHGARRLGGGHVDAD